MSMIRGESVKLLKKEGDNLIVIEDDLEIVLEPAIEDDSHTLWKGNLEGKQSIKKGNIIERHLTGEKLEVIRIVTMEAKGMRVKDNLITQLTLKDYDFEDSYQTTNRQIPNNNITRIFIGHGGSHIWRELKDFIEYTLNLPYEEYNRISPAGKTSKDRLEEMLEVCSMAFLIMTGEDEQTDGSSRARENVVHEVGLFQGKLGFEKAIILLEEGCERFSNIDGITYIGFPKGKIKAAFEDIREVLKRESILE